MNDIRLVFEEGLGWQAAEALEKGLRECGVAEAFRLELGPWELEAEIVWLTGQSPAWKVWKGWAYFRVHPEKGPEPILPLLSVEVNEGEVTFPNLDQVVQAICQMG